MSRSLAQISGPGLGGGLVSVIAAPFAMLIHSITLISSAIFLILIKTKEDAQSRKKRSHLFLEI